MTVQLCLWPYSPRGCCGWTAESPDLPPPRCLLWLRSSSTFPLPCCAAPRPPAAGPPGQRSGSSPPSAGSLAAPDRCAAGEEYKVKFLGVYFCIFYVLQLRCNLQLPQFEVSQVSQGQVGSSGCSGIWGSALEAVLQTEELEALIEGVAAQQRTDNLTSTVLALSFHQLLA